MSSEKNDATGHDGGSRPEGMHAQAEDTVTAGGAGPEFVNTSSPDGGKKVKLESVRRGGKVLPLMKKMQAAGQLDERLVNFLKGLPSMIMQNGLGQTVAYLQTKGEKEREVGSLLQKVLLPQQEGGGLMQGILDADVKTYLHWQREALEYAGWMKKFAVAFEKGNDQGKDGKHAAK